MFLQIVQHIPRWVWVLLAALIALGFSQSVTRRRTVRSATLVPLLMVALSLFGVVSVFSQSIALIAWAVGVAGALALSNAVGAWRTIKWSEPDQCLIVPGSWVPMVLILGLFATKFGVNVVLAINHELALNMMFATSVGFIYGAFSGTFLGRGVVMWKAARQAFQASVAS